MDRETKMLFQLLEEEDKEAQYKAFILLLESMEEEVDWIYEVWDQLVEDLTSKDNHKRSRAGQFLCYLAISDSEKRLLNDFEKIWKVTYDDKFVTARHTLQASWHIGLAGEQQLERLLDSYEERFKEAMIEKNGSLIRSDISKNLKKIYTIKKNIEIKQLSLSLIDLEENVKYKKKYERIWQYK